MKDEIWIMQQEYVSGDDPFDIEFSRGSAVRISLAAAGRNYQAKHSSSGHKSGGFNQSFIKITGHKYNAGGLKSHVDYITRNGGIDLENEEGEVFNSEPSNDKSTPINGVNEADNHTESQSNNPGDSSFKNEYDPHKNDIKNDPCAEWVADFETRQNEKSHTNKTDKRVASSFVFSSPEGTNTDDLIQSVREFAQKNFEGHRYVFAAHTPDTETIEAKKTANPHVHLVVENISPGKEKALETNPEILRQWRKDYAEISHSHGIETVEMNIGSKPAIHEKNQNVYRMLQKGEIPDKYKEHYQTAKDRVARGDIHTTPKEQAIIDRAVNDFVDRQRQIDDLKKMMEASSDNADNLKYSKQISYLKQVNASTRMPASNSQMFMKHAIEQNDRREGGGSKQFNAVPTVKHFMYAQKLAKAHGVEMPAASNVSVKRLSQFVKDYKDKATPKHIDLIKTMAKDRGIKLYEDDISSHKSAMNWMKSHKDDPTIKQYQQANKLSKSLGIDLPDKLDGPGLKAFISENIKKPSKQMMAFASAISEKTGVKLDDKILADKGLMAEFIAKHKPMKQKQTQRVDELKKQFHKNINQSEVERETTDKSVVSKSTYQKAVAAGYIPNDDDKIDDASLEGFKKAITPKKESERWTKAINKIEPPEQGHTKSRDVSGPDI